MCNLFSVLGKHKLLSRSHTFELFSLLTIHSKGTAKFASKKSLLETCGERHTSLCHLDKTESETD